MGPVNNRAHSPSDNWMERSLMEMLRRFLKASLEENKIPFPTTMQSTCYPQFGLLAIQLKY